MQSIQGIKVTSFNVNGVHNPIKRGKILSKLNKEKTQIAFLQETHLNETEHIKLGRLHFKYVYSSCHWSGNKIGVAILINEVSLMNIKWRRKTGRGDIIIIMIIIVMHFI